MQPGGTVIGSGFKRFDYINPRGGKIAEAPVAGGNFKHHNDILGIDGEDFLVGFYGAVIISEVLLDYPHQFQRFHIVRGEVQRFLNGRLSLLIFTKIEVLPRQFQPVIYVFRLVLDFFLQYRDILGLREMVPEDGLQAVADDGVGGVEFQHLFAGFAGFVPFTILLIDFGQRDDIFGFCGIDFRGFLEMHLCSRRVPLVLVYHTQRVMQVIAFGKSLHPHFIDDFYTVGQFGIFFGQLIITASRLGEIVILSRSV